MGRDCDDEQFATISAQSSAVGSVSAKAAARGCLGRRVVTGRERTRVALFATHPIQYHVPWFQHLAARPELDLKIYFGFEPDAAQQGIGFGIDFKWDIPLREGYASELLQNVAPRPALGTFGGCDTPEVGDVLRAWAPDAVILTGWQSKMLIQAAWAAKRLGVPRIIRGESNALRQRAAWKRLLHRAWLRTYDQFLAIGRANEAFYRQAGVRASRIHPCPYFVDNERFVRDAGALAPRREELRRAWAIAEASICFLYSGKLIGKKRPFDLLEALKVAHARGIPAHLLVVGDGELGADLRSFAAEAQLPVTFAGFLNQTDMAKAYVAADCLVLPSDTGETWGLVVNEAMACGIPALVSDQVGCGPDLVSEGVTGRIYPMGDVAALAQRLMDLSRRPQELRTMGAAARQRVLSGYTVEHAVEGTLAAVAAAVGAR